jgi:hypothetical protein
LAKKGWESSEKKRQKLIMFDTKLPLIASNVHWRCFSVLRLLYRGKGETPSACAGFVNYNKHETERYQLGETVDFADYPKNIRLYEPMIILMIDNLLRFRFPSRKAMSSITLSFVSTAIILLLSLNSFCSL